MLVAVKVPPPLVIAALELFESTIAPQSSVIELLPLTATSPEALGFNAYRQAGLLTELATDLAPTVTV